MEIGDYMLHMKQEIKLYKINWILVKVKMEIYLIYNPTTSFANVK